MNKFLKVRQGKIVQGTRQPVVLKGINLGGWLMMEGYLLNGANIPEKRFREEFARRLGKKALEDFDESFRNAFVREEDICTIARWGFNCIRVPFHYRVVESAPFQYQGSGLRFLDKVIGWAKKHKIWVILDLHAAVGSQNKDWHADSSGEALFWARKSYQERMLSLWEFLADRYQDTEAIAGYDLLNETVLDDPGPLNRFYKALIGRLRAIDRNHILFVEGNTWATDLACLEEFSDDNYALSIHSYEPPAVTFNFVPHLRYPSPDRKDAAYSKALLRRHLNPYARLARERGLAVLVGEFGVNYRQGHGGEERWVKDMLECFREYGFHWTYWTYKAVKNSVYPDGIFSYYENPPWVRREGPVCGWETYPSCWSKMKKEMIHSWHTKAFEVNTHILKTLRHGAR